MKVSTILKKSAAPVLGIMFLLVLVAYIADAFSGEKVAPGTVEPKAQPAPDHSIEAEQVILPVWYEAVGTVRSYRRIYISPQVPARILSVNKRAGDRVKQGEVLVRPDDAGLQSRLRQAKEGVVAAQAAYLQARQSLLAAESQVRQMEAYHTQAQQSPVRAQAQLTQAQVGLSQAESAMVSARHTTGMQCKEVYGLSQAESAMVSARAEYERAASEYRRYQELVKTKAATEQELEARKAQYEQAKAAMESAEKGIEAARAQISRLEAALKQTYEGVKAAAAQVEQAKAGVEQAREAVKAAQAHVRRAEEVVKEAEIALTYTVIKAPEDGVIAKRIAEPGDLALPGKPVLVIHDPARLRLEANVPESLLDRVGVGERLQVVIDALGATLDAKVDEVVPSGDPRSRTFIVKALLPSVEGLMPGMFGRLRIKQAEREAILVPRTTIRKVGQLETVIVKTNGRWKERFVRTGASAGEKVEVLAGLEPGEQVAVEKAQ